MAKLLGEEIVRIIRKYKERAWHLQIPRQGGLGPQIAQKLYRNVPFGAYGDHEPNICIEIGAPANRRRAEGSLYVLETAFTVQRALCTFEGKGHPVQKVTPWSQFA